METLKFKVSQTDITIVEKPEKITANNVEFIKCEFDLDDAFNGLLVRAVFGSEYRTLENNCCYAPPLHSGLRKIGVYGYSLEDGEYKLVISPQPVSIVVKEGSFDPDAVKGNSPSPTELEIHYAAVKSLIDSGQDSIAALSSAVAGLSEKSINVLEDKADVTELEDGVYFCKGSVKYRDSSNANPSYGEIYNHGILIKDAGILHISAFSLIKLSRKRNRDRTYYYVASNVIKYNQSPVIDAANDKSLDDSGIFPISILESNRKYDLNLPATGEMVNGFDFSGFEDKAEPIVNTGLFFFAGKNFSVNREQWLAGGTYWLKEPFVTEFKKNSFYHVEFKEYELNDFNVPTISITEFYNLPDSQFAKRNIWGSEEAKKNTWSEEK